MKKNIQRLNLYHSLVFFLIVNIFTVIIDDWNLKEVRKWTFDAFRDLGIIVISKIEIKTTQNSAFPKFIHSHYSDWHSGYFIAVCEKSGK